MEKILFRFIAFFVSFAMEFACLAVILWIVGFAADSRTLTFLAWYILFVATMSALSFKQIAIFWISAAVLTKTIAVFVDQNWYLTTPGYKTPVLSFGAGCCFSICMTALCFWAMMHAYRKAVPTPSR